MQENNSEASSSIDVIRQGRINKANELRDKGFNPYPYKFIKTASAKELQEKYKNLAEGEETADRYSVAGRVMAIRNSGMFIDIIDDSGKIQIFSHKQNIDNEKLKLLKLVDIGDIIGFTGDIRRTPRGELSIKAVDFEILTKSLKPLPEKFHGLTDVEAKYRERYVDLMMNEESRKIFLGRSKYYFFVRKFLNEHGFLEVETPVIQTSVSGATAKPFFTHYNALDIDCNLRIAPECYLKELIAAGFDKVYEFAKIGRAHV